VNIFLPANERRRPKHDRANGRNHNYPDRGPTRKSGNEPEPRHAHGPDAGYSARSDLSGRIKDNAICNLMLFRYNHGALKISPAGTKHRLPSPATAKERAGQAVHAAWLDLPPTTALPGKTNDDAEASAASHRRHAKDVSAPGREFSIPNNLA
jgi:hypothetical protein